jgi:TP901 family phage tail tape measure protein
MAGIRAQLNLEVNSDKVKRSLQKATSEINKIVNKTAGKQVGFNVNEKSFTQPLGRINASANEFSKSLEASNARVIAFGASVAIIDGISDAFKNLVIQAVNFEKTLADINAVMSLSNSQLEAFGSNLFEAAKSTAQGFNVAAEAALEFSRQGLSTEEVIRRTNDALILTRLTSLKATDAVSGLTAAINAFGGAGLSTTDIIDKLSAVDVNFAVSSADLINALQRSGAVAIDAGVELDKLIGIVAALQQTTARGGAVIGNSLKTIFTRIQRPESIKQIENLGIVVRDLSGAVLPADKILVNMANSFDELTQAQQSNVVQFSAGIFQANVFRAALADLAKENSLTTKATEISANASGEAARKNEILNQTISAMSSRAATSLQELAAVMGELGLSDSIGTALEFVNDRVSEIKDGLGGGEAEGSDFAKGLVRGIGNVLTGPGVIAFGAIFIKLFFNIAKFAQSSMKDVLGIVNRKEQLRQMEESIVRVMGENANIQQALNNLEGDRASQEAFILGIIERQTNALQKQKALARDLSSTLLNKGVSTDLTYQTKGSEMVDLDGNGKPDLPYTARGLLPEQKLSERVGALRAGYTPGEVATTNIKGLGQVIYNKAETIKQFPGMEQPAIMPPKQSKAGGKYSEKFQEKHGFDPYASQGFVPNFASLMGHKLVMNKSKFKLFGNSKDLGSAIGEKWMDIEEKIKNKAPVTINSSLNKIINSSSDNSNKAPTKKERLYKTFVSLASAGVRSIERDFDVRPIPKTRNTKQLKGENSAQFAERRVINQLNQEQQLNKDQGLDHSKYIATRDPVTKKGVATYPIDTIALGQSFPSYEVKSGELIAANLISKSLRMASDTELEDWMKSQGMIKKDLGERNLSAAQRLAQKLGIKGTGEGEEFTQEDAEEWGMNKGFIPNFKKLYRGTSGYPGSRATNVAGAYWDNPVNLYKDVIQRSMQATDELQAKAPTVFKNKMTYGVDEYNINDSLFNQLSTGVYKAQNVIKLKKFVDNFDLDDIRHSDGIDEDFYDGAQEERGRAIDSMKKQKGSKKIPGTASNPLPLIQELRKGVYSFPDLGRGSEYRDSLLKRDEDQIENLFDWKKTGGRKLNPEFQNNRGFFEGVSGHGGDKALRGSMFGGKAGLRQAMESSAGLIPNFGAQGSGRGRNWKEAYENLIKLYNDGKINSALDISNAMGITKGVLSNYALDKTQKKANGKEYRYATGMINEIGQDGYEEFQRIYDEFVIKNIANKKFSEGRDYEALIGWLIGQSPGYNSRLDWTGARTVIRPPEGSKLNISDYIGNSKRRIAAETLAKKSFDAQQGAGHNHGVLYDKITDGLNLSPKPGEPFDTRESLFREIVQDGPGVDPVSKQHKMKVLGGAYFKYTKDTFQPTKKVLNAWENHKTKSSGINSDGLSHDGFVPNFHYWQKFIKWSKGPNGWGLRGDDFTLTDFANYLQNHTDTNPQEIAKINKQIQGFKAKASKDLKGLGGPSMGREGAKHYASRSAIQDRKGTIDLNGIFIKNLKDKVDKYNSGRSLGSFSDASSGLIPNFADIIPFDNTTPFKKKTIKSKNLMHQEYLKAYAEGENQFKSGQTMLQFLSQFYDPKTLQDLRKYPEDYNILSEGFIPNFSRGPVPNFANPLMDAINRERSAGLPDSKIRVEKSPQLKSPKNPMGLAVTNTRDEPGGVQQGISRARKMGINPKEHGAAHGLVPNFVMGIAGTESYGQGSLKKPKLRGPSAGFENVTKSLKSLNNEVDDLTDKINNQQESINSETEARDNSQSAQIDGLQKLFYMQSTISMANGFLQQFAETGTGAAKQLAEFSLGLSDTLSTFITAKEVGNQLMDLADIKPEEGVGIQEIIGSKRVKDLSSGKGLSATVSKAMGGVMNFGKGLLRFAPLIGQAVTAFTAVNSAVKQFGHLLGFEQGAGIMDLFSSASERATRSIERLSKSTEALENTLGALQSQSENTEKIQELESMGSLRTQKQEAELFKLKMKDLDIQTKVQKSMSQLFEKNVVGSAIAGQLSEQFSQSGITVEEQTSTLQKLIKVQKQRIAIEQGTEAFGKLIQEKFNDLTSGFDFSTISGQDAKLLQQASGFRGAQAGMALSGVMAGGEELDAKERLNILSENISVVGQFDLNKITESSVRSIRETLSSQLKGTKEFGGALIASHIADIIDTIDDAEDNVSGFQKVEAKAIKHALDAFVTQLKKQKNKLEKSDAAEDFEQSTKQVRDAYVRIIAEYKNQRQQLIHQNSISDKINSTQRKILESTDGILAQYGGISSDFEIRQKTERELASINEKYKSAVDKYNVESLKGMQKTAESLINTGQLAQDFTLGMERSKEAVKKLASNLSTGVNLDQLSSIVNRLGVDLSSAQSIKLDELFLKIASEASSMKDNGEVVNALMKEYGKILDPTVAAAFLVALNEKKIAGLQEKDIQALSERVKNHERSVESAKVDQETSQKILKQKEIQELIQKKTVDGAINLEKLLSKQGDFSSKALKEIQGEAATLKVLNKFQKDRVSILIRSGKLDEKARELQIEKNRKEAESSILSLKQLEAQQVILNTQNQSSEEYQNIIRAQQAKLKQEVVSAKLSQEEAKAREEFLSYEDTRKRLAQAQIETEQSNANTASSINLTKLQLEVAQKKLLENVMTQIEEEITSAQKSALISAKKVSILKASSKQSKLLQKANELQEASNKYLELENAIRKATISKGSLDINAQADINTEKANKISSIRENIARNKILANTEELSSLSKLEIEEELQSTQGSALIASEKAIILSEMGEQGRLLKQANELQASANKLIELENAIRKATISNAELSLSVGAQVGIDRAASVAGTRAAAARSLTTGRPEDALAFAQSLEETNKQLGIGSRTLDRLRTRIAEINVSWENLGADLVDIGLDSARSGVQKVFEEIGSGAKTAEQAWNDFGLNLAKQLLDRFTQANVDRIFANLAYAFTGVDPTKDAAKVANQNGPLVLAIEGLSGQKDSLARATKGLQAELRSGINIRADKIDTSLSKQAEVLTEPLRLLRNKIEDLTKAVLRDVESRVVKDSKEGDAPDLSGPAALNIREDKQKAFESKQKSQAKGRSSALSNKLSQEFSEIDSSIPLRPLQDVTSNVSKYSQKAQEQESITNPIDLLSKEKKEDIVAAMSVRFKNHEPTYSADVFNRNAKGFVDSTAYQEPMVPPNAGYEIFRPLNHIFPNDEPTVGNRSLEEAAQSSGLASSEAAQLSNLNEAYLGLNKLNESLLDLKYATEETPVKDLALKDLDSDLNNLVVSATGASLPIQGVKQAIVMLADTMKAKAKEIQNLMNSMGLSTSPPPDQGTSSPDSKHFGGMVQKFAKGGFVKGPRGEDKVPAMLTAGEYVIPKERVKQLAQRDELQYLYKGGGVKAQYTNNAESDRFVAGIKGATQAATMAIVTDKLGDSINKKQDTPPTFNKQKLKNLDLGSDVSLRSGDPRLSGKALARDPAMAEYRDYLMDLAAYRNQKKNEKFQKRMGVFSSILSSVHSLVLGEVTEIAKEPINKYVVNPIKNAASSVATKADNWRGKTFGKYSKQYETASNLADQKGYDLNYKDFRNSMDGYKGELKDLGFYADQGGIKFLSPTSGEVYDMNSLESIRSMPTSDQMMVYRSKALINPHNRSITMDQFVKQDSAFYNNQRLDTESRNKYTKAARRASGGSIPTMLTDGEAIIPSEIAKRIGYSSLTKMNKTGEIPIVSGKKGIDKVGPVGLTPGDFVIRKSSTDKLLKENPRMMRFAMQNPDGFRKAEQRYYQGGIVGTSGSSVQVPSVNQTTGTGSRTTSQPINRIQPLISSSQQNAPQKIQQQAKNDVTNNINVSVTVDQSGNEKVSNEAGGNKFEQEQALAMKIKTKVIEVIREEKRIGGELG